MSLCGFAGTIFLVCVCLCLGSRSRTHDYDVKFAGLVCIIKSGKKIQTVVPHSILANRSTLSSCDVCWVLRLPLAGPKSTSTRYPSSSSVLHRPIPQRSWHTINSPFVGTVTLLDSPIASYSQ